MRYLTLIADYTQSGLHDDYAGPVVPEEMGLSTALGDRIRDWNARYRAIIPLDKTQHVQPPTADLIESLDREGLSLVRDISAAHPDLKIRYYSEGLLGYVT